MLVLSRKAGDTIRINEDIVLQIVAIDGERVKVGVLAPEEVRVLRGELCEQKPKIAAA